MDRWATFDCYGTLIDWNGGIGRELERLFGAARGGEQLRAYHELEPEIQREDPGRSYREVMARRARPPRRSRRRAGRARTLAAEVGAVSRGAGGARGGSGARLEAGRPLEHRPRPPRRVARADRGRVRSRRSSRPRSARTSPLRPTGTSSSQAPGPTARSTSTSAPASSTTSLPRPRSACARSGSTGSARMPSLSPMSSCAV